MTNGRFFATDCKLFLVLDYNCNSLGSAQGR